MFAAILGACCHPRPATRQEPFADQVFESSGSVWNTEVAVNPRGGFLVAGIVQGAVRIGNPIAASTQDAFVAWFDDTGLAVLSVALPGPETETNANLAVDESGAAVLVRNAVTSRSGGGPPPRGGYPPSPKLHKLDHEGRKLWSRALPPGTQAGPAVDGDGNVYVSGASAYFQPGHCELIQWTPDGREGWRRTLLENSARCTGSIRADPARDLTWVIVERGGPAEPLGGSEPRDVRALGFSPSGQQRGEVRLPVDEWQAIDLYEPLPDGGVLLLGRDRDRQRQLSAFWGVATIEGPRWLRRVETEHLAVGQSALGQAGPTRGWLLAGALAGPMELGGERLEAGTDHRSVLLALRDSGDISWARLIPGSGDEYGQRIVRLRSGRVVLVSTRAGSALVVRDVTALAGEAAGR